jgi:predicted ABC-type ATPase
MTPPADKSMKKRLRKLAAIAHERELAAALKELHAGFADWQAGKIDSFELSDRIHAFNQETAREIWKMYLPARPSGMQIARALAGLAPFEPERAAFRAGRLMLEEIFIHARRGESFAFETTLSGRGYARLISGWRADGYLVKLFFLRLATPELAIARVRQRVREGGHNVPEPVIRRRFDAGRHNFENMYKPAVNEWALYDNSGREPVLIEEGVKS